MSGVAAQLKYRARIRTFLNEQKDKPCADCQIKYPYYVMQFDHVRGEKLFNIGTIYNYPRAMSKVIEEIEKCDIVCANCHAARTWNRLKNNGM